MSTANRTGRRAPATLTHWAPYDAPVTNRTVLAACGQRVYEREIVKKAALPTCVACLDASIAFESLLED